MQTQLQQQVGWIDLLRVIACAMMTAALFILGQRFRATRIFVPQKPR